MKRLILFSIFVICAFLPFSIVMGTSKTEIAFFSSPGCSECMLTRNYLDSLKEVYPQIEITEYSVAQRQNSELLAKLGSKYGLPKNKINVTPTVFIGTKAFVREETFYGLDKIIEGFDETENSYLEEAINEGGNSHLVDLFKRFGILTVIGAGLIDGYNPCAITVLIFFISLLTLRGKSRREMLLVGVSFTLGIGLSYLLLGIGLFQVISRWKYFDYISRWVYLATALITFVLVVFTLSDYLKARKGDTKGMALQLSQTEKKTIHSLLRNPKVATGFIFSFLVAFPVSIVEFSCTGQTYLPTIVYIFGMDTLKARALLYLILYNIMFVLPLVAIILGVYKGASSERITKWFTKNLSQIKLYTGIVFILLFTYLLLKTLSLFEIIALRL